MSDKVSRRRFLAVGGGLAVGGFVTACGGGPGGAGGAGGTAKYQIAWTGDNGVLGEVVADAKGWYKEAGVNLTFQPGGPNVNGVTLVSGGAAAFGQNASSPAVMMARSQGQPVRAFAVGVQQHPLAYISLPGNPVRKPKDLIGKTVGIQAGGDVVLDAVLAANNIDKSKVKVQVVGSDFTPLKRGKVDAMAGWITNLEAFSILDEYETLRVWDSGVHLYGNVYFATDATIEKRPKMLQGFVEATARGYEYAHAHLDEAVEMLVKKYPGLKKESQFKASEVLLKLIFTEATAKGGWGAMSRDVWQQQISQYTRLKQFTSKPPTVDKVMTTDVLRATAASRPKLG
ncbi:MULTISPECIES: ABC transporter substrate-binding protein [Streptomyces violaceusniger group]|uniref:Thiamine pyrimidine synthase n=1 Tax=Streptomyces rhizosphaericus TaxID=114699 RepID=A0A6G4AA06_9ACTN|nr:ABC transporter substrate-binding protein [Streptomyces rhizosphaericus]NEW69327.1 ABC transporter substrate-binding protein [Streptomyces rhizosphaericus]